MSEEEKKQLKQQLWSIANTLRGKMNADEFRDFILGIIQGNCIKVTFTNPSVLINRPE